MQAGSDRRSRDDPQAGLGRAASTGASTSSTFDTPGDRELTVPGASDATSDRSGQVDQETIGGYVMDIACIRKAPAEELADRAANHPTSCGLMGHCIESGYGLVDGDGRVHLLEPQATIRVVRHLLDTDVEAGVRLRVVRRRDGHEMETSHVEAVASSPSHQPPEG